MELFLVRHGPAEERDPRKWPDDEDRPLSPPGIRATRRAAVGFARSAGSIDRLATSPARRALRTAQLFADALDPSPRLELWKELAPGAPSAAAFARLRTTAKARTHIALFGHEPGLGELAGWSLTGEGTRLIRLSRGGAAMIEFGRAVVPSGGRLRWMLTRKQLDSRR